MEKVMVALITPFTKENEVDYEALTKIVKRLMREGCDGFIVCGTTAETPTLKEAERYAVLQHVLSIVQGNCEVWFGCGRNCTRDTIRLIRKAQKYAISGVLVVTPYYNKPSQRGLYEHYHAIASSVDTKLMLYNVPGRCGVELQYDTIRKLVYEHKTIVGLKQASHDLDTVIKLKKEFPQFQIYSGEDGYFDEGLDVGMDGLISVMGHFNMEKIQRFIKEGRKDNRLKKELYKEATLAFCDASPAPVKYLLSRKRECENLLRLPMCPVNREKELLLSSYFDKEED
ncbi:4-hydroxy-tetrahydrodipicolinate synthase [[Eubacterium] hominis]|uniref:4-hydroxy-tetrahydrodipicolinate synthase n=1 Tax=[Eubacterium] hominis TaxID=2764325 RepID=UPI003A4D3425